MQSVSEQPVEGSFYHSAMMGLRRRKLSIGLRMTPMIDVIFLLLTFFVLTAKFQQPEQSLPILMGQAQAQIVDNDTIDILIHISPTDNGCAVSIAGGTPVSIVADEPGEGLLKFTETIQNYIESAGRGPVELQCDDAVSWDLVVKIYDVLYTLGAEDITFRIEQ